MSTRYTLLAAAVLLAACAGGGDDGAGEAAEEAPDVSVLAPPPVPFDTVAARVVTEGRALPITVELADTEEQRTRGLMERESLGQDHGMLFRYGAEQAATAGFWMYRTWIPLDIAFLDADGTIVAIRQMDPCRSSIPDVCGADTTAPGVPYHSALEMPRGWFAAHSVGTGDRVELVEATPEDGTPPS